MTKKQKNLVEENEKQGILDDLDDLDKAIIRFKMDGIGNTQIAKKTGKHYNTITVRLKKIKVQQALDELRKSALEIIIDSQNEAARILRSIMRDKEEKSADRIAACKVILAGIIETKIKHTVEFENQIEKLDEITQKYILNYKDD